MAPPKKNPLKRALRNPAFRKRVVRPRKGKGAYRRKGREGSF